MQTIGMRNAEVRTWRRRAGTHRVRKANGKRQGNHPNAEGGTRFGEFRPPSPRPSPPGEGAGGRMRALRAATGECERHEMMKRRSRSGTTVDGAKSGLIKPNKAKMFFSKGQTKMTGGIQQEATEATEANKVDQGQSNQIKLNQTGSRPNKTDRGR